MSEVTEFVSAPTEEFLDKCTKDQLLRIADHYKIEISDKRLKDTVKSILRANLSDMGVLTVSAEQPPPAVSKHQPSHYRRECLDSSRQP